MKIYLLDINKDMTDHWKNEFNKYPEIEIINDTLESFLNSNPGYYGIVSPANSFGLMDGGYDKAIIDYFGKNIEESVQNYIKSNYCGCQPVGSCFTLSFDKCALLHTPTMRTPEKIVDSRVIFDCMLSCLNDAKRNNIDSVIIPAFGGCTGEVSTKAIAKYMSFAYHVFKSNFSMEWGIALYIKHRLYEIREIS